MTPTIFYSPQSILWGGYFFVIATVIVAGDSFYTAYVYPVIAPIVTLQFCSWANVRPYYLSGVAVIVYLSMLIYLSINWFSSNPEGFLVIGHLLSLPGLVIGSIALAKWDHVGTHGHAASLFLGTVGAGIGFLVAQTLACNTVIYCGWISQFLN
ncbi:MAG: hypothetical protein Q8K87_00075 [Hydrogenophaga sp.]|nr:hypothetical protein [Hydrogenophaga sp.]